MSSKNTAVFGIYATAQQAERAVDGLIAAGFPSASISVLLPDTASTKEFAHQKDTKAPEGTTVGVTTGGVIGGTLGVLAGIGALAIPGVGPSDRRRTDYGRFGRPRCRRGSGRLGWCARRDGHPGVRSESVTKAR